MNVSIINKWSYYYFFFGIGPPIGLQNLEEKAVGGGSAHGFFYDQAQMRRSFPETINYVGPTEKEK